MKELRIADCGLRIDLASALKTATEALLGEMGAHGHWEGGLSSSALSTATAVVALATMDGERNGDLIRGGLRWLADHQNADGGWGDTTRSRSNISTSALCWAAFGAARADGEYADVVERAEGALGSIRVPRVGDGVPPTRTSLTVREHDDHPSTADAFESPFRRDAETNARDERAPQSPGRALHHVRIFRIRPRRTDRRPAQRARADVAPAPRRVAPAAVRILILREPAQPAANQVPMPLAVHRCERDDGRRGGKRAARKLAFPMPMRPHFRHQRLRRSRQRGPHALRSMFDVRCSMFDVLRHPHASLSCSRFRAGITAHAPLQPKTRLSSSRFRLTQA